LANALISLFTIKDPNFEILVEQESSKESEKKHAVDIEMIDISSIGT
tara:strand:+ start:304 stop:444 length:141 start_codon:yes stop_codon:yes gene_type:complete